MTIYSQQFQEDGFVVVLDLANRNRCDALARHVETIAREGAGSRTLLDQPWCVELAHESRQHSELGRAIFRWGWSGSGRFDSMIGESGAGKARTAGIYFTARASTPSFAQLTFASCTSPALSPLLRS
jgi:hypothetical protein